MKNGMICVLIVRWRMTDTVKYKTVSLRNNIYAKLETMSELLVEGVKLSIPQTIELLLKQEENSQELKSGWGRN